MNARFLAIARDPRLIPGVHHYCDEWCAYCPVPDRCLAFRCTVEWRKQLQRGDDEPPFTTVAEALAFTRQVAEAEGISTDDLDAIEARGPGGVAPTTTDPLASVAWEYSTRAARLLASLPPSAGRGGSDDGAPSPAAVVLWYHMRIYMKLFRALVARDRTRAGEGDRTEEANGCAKLTLIAVQRSRAALPMLGFASHGVEIERLCARLDALELGIDERFPQARQFIRIGLDVPAAA